MNFQYPSLNGFPFPTFQLGFHPGYWFSTVPHETINSAWDSNLELFRRWTLLANCSHFRHFWNWLMVVNWGFITATDFQPVPLEVPAIASLHCNGKSHSDILAPVILLSFWLSYADLPFYQRRGWAIFVSIHIRDSVHQMCSHVVNSSSEQLATMCCVDLCWSVLTNYDC